MTFRRAFNPISLLLACEMELGCSHHSPVSTFDARPETSLVDTGSADAWDPTKGCGPPPRSGRYMDDPNPHTDVSWPPDHWISDGRRFQLAHYSSAASREYKGPNIAVELEHGWAFVGSEIAIADHWLGDLKHIEYIPTARRIAPSRGRAIIVDTSEHSWMIDPEGHLSRWNPFAPTPIFQGSFSDGSHGLILLEGGTLYETKDGAKTFQRVPSEWYKPIKLEYYYQLGVFVTLQNGAIRQVDNGHLVAASKPRPRPRLSMNNSRAFVDYFSDIDAQHPTPCGFSPPPIQTIPDPYAEQLRSVETLATYECKLTFPWMPFPAIRSHHNWSKLTRGRIVEKGSAHWAEWRASSDRGWVQHSVPIQLPANTQTQWTFSDDHNALLESFVTTVVGWGHSPFDSATRLDVSTQVQWIRNEQVLKTFDPKGFQLFAAAPLASGDMVWLGKRARIDRPERLPIGLDRETEFEWLHDRRTTYKFRLLRLSPSGIEELPVPVLHGEDTRDFGLATRGNEAHVVSCDTFHCRIWADDGSILLDGNVPIASTHCDATPAPDAWSIAVRGQIPTWITTTGLDYEDRIPAPEEYSGTEDDIARVEIAHLEWSSKGLCRRGVSVYRHAAEDGSAQPAAYGTLEVTGPTTMAGWLHGDSASIEMRCTLRKKSPLDS